MWMENSADGSIGSNLHTNVLVSTSLWGVKAENRVHIATDKLCLDSFTVLSLLKFRNRCVLCVEYFFLDGGSDNINEAQQYSCGLSNCKSLFFDDMGYRRVALRHVEALRWGCGGLIDDVMIEEKDLRAAVSRGVVSLNSRTVESFLFRFSAAPHSRRLF